MIKNGFLPFIRPVARVAFSSIPAAMRIINFMATDTLFGCVLIFVSDMA
jgi:hypothetical protein